MKKLYAFLLGVTLSATCFSQSDSTLFSQDSVPHFTWGHWQIIPETEIRAYTSPEVISTKALNRYNNTSILPVVNSMPGVRMEERSPNSFRFGIRGSSAQTPFGVRNIKMYYNGIPYTDAGGNTYLNNLGFYNMQNISIKKGPSSSLYGAGIGGVVSIYSMPDRPENTALVHYTTGSYGLQSVAGEFYINDSVSQHAIRYQHSEAQGYRQQSASKKDVLSYDLIIETGKKNELSANILYSELTYQTPGGLTLAQYNTDGTKARPATPTIPGAIDNKATIYQKSFLAGITNDFSITNKWKNYTTLFTSYNQLINPTIRNFSRSAQPNVGGRTVFNFETKKGMSTFKWATGGEAQQQFVTEKTYQNNSGTPGIMMNDVEINNLLAFGFTQLKWQRRNIEITGGLSLSSLSVDINSFIPTYTKQSKQYNNELAPCLSAKYWIKNSFIYALAEKGYTPPSVSELSPTGSNINLDLQSTKGWNYAIGSAGYFFGNKLYYDLSLFNFRLSQAIVQRRDSAGGDYYINSGGTDQYGLEALIRYTIRTGNQNEFVKAIDISLAYTGYDFKYKNFTQLTTDYTGKKLPGVPDHVVSGSVDVDTKIGAYLNLSYYYCSGIFLNDANTDQANDYTLLGGRIGYRKTIKRVLLDVFAGGDNLLDKKYSLGNDINAAGGRYYNAAPGINFFAGLTFGYRYKK